MDLYSSIRGGIDCIAGVYLFLYRKTAFPGINALLPSLASAAIIYAAPRTRLGVLFSNPVSRWLGVVSYSLYLVHWPVITFYRTEVDAQIDLSAASMLLVIIFIGAAVLHYAIERPLRYAPLLGSLRMRPATILNIVGSVMVAALALSFSLIQGWSWRISDPALLVTREDIAKERARYWENRPDSLIDNTKPQIAIIGDSQAIDLFYAFHENGYPNLNLLSYPFACDDLMDVGPEADQSKDWKKTCGDRFQEIASSEAVKNAGIIAILEHWVSAPHKRFAEAMSKLRTASPQARIVVFGPRLEFRTQPLDILAKARDAADANENALHDYNADRLEVKQQIQHLAKASGVEFFDVMSTMCGSAPCELLHNGELTYFDRIHWTAAGAKYFGRNMISSGLDKYLAPLTERPGVAPVVIEEPVLSPVAGAKDGAEYATATAVPVVSALSPEFVLINETGEKLDGLKIFAATSKAEAGQRRIRYRFRGEAGQNYSVEWRLKPLASSRHNLLVWDIETQLLGSIQIDWNFDGESVIEGTKDIISPRIVKERDGWYSVNFQVMARASSANTQLLYYVSPHVNSDRSDPSEKFYSCRLL